MRAYTSAFELFSYRGDIEHGRTAAARLYFQFATLSLAARTEDSA